MTQDFHGSAVQEDWLFSEPTDYSVFQQPRPHWWSGNSVYRFSSAGDENLPSFDTDGNQLEEAVFRTFAPEERGGKIVFATDINATLKLDDNFFNRLRARITAFLQSYRNRWQVKGKISKILDRLSSQSPDFANINFSVGPYYKGRYRSPDGKTYDETSVAVEIIGITKQILIDLATEIAREFQQEEVLVFDHTTGQIFTVDRN